MQGAGLRLGFDGAVGDLSWVYTLGGPPPGNSGIIGK